MIQTIEAMLRKKNHERRDRIVIDFVPLKHVQHTEVNASWKTFSHGRSFYILTTSSTAHCYKDVILLAQRRQFMTYQDAIDTSHVSIIWYVSVVSESKERGAGES